MRLKEKAMGEVNEFIEIVYFAIVKFYEIQL